MAVKEILLHFSCQRHQIENDQNVDGRAEKREEAAGLHSH
jgi:hypothetical protein